MKKVLFTFIVLSIFLGIIVFLGCGPKESGLIKIGVILPLTGDLASYGQNAKDGIGLFVDEYNGLHEQKGTKKISVLYEDSKNQPDQAVAAINKFISLDKVIAVIGDVGSSPTLAMAPIANKNKIVIISPAASSPEISKAGPYIFRVWPSDVFEADRMAQYVNKVEIKRLSLLSVNNDYGKAMVNEFKAMTSSTKLKIVTEDYFEQNVTDLRLELTKIKTSNPDGIYLISYPKETMTILRQIKELGIKIKILATSSFEDPLVLNEIDNNIQNPIFTSPIPPREADAEVAAFKENYEKRFGKKPGLVADYGYDAMKVIIEAVTNSNKITNESVFSGIQKMDSIKGATGIIKFDSNGDVLKPAGIKTVINGKYEWLEKQE